MLTFVPRKRDVTIMENIRKPFTLDRVVRLVIAVVIALAVLWLLDYLKGVLIPFAVACLIAYMMNPLVEWNRRVLRLRGRGVPTILSILEVAAVITAVLWLLLPYVYQQARDLVVMCGDYMRAQFTGPYLSAAVNDFIRDNLDMEYLRSLLTREQWAQLISSAAGSMWNAVGETLSAVMTVLSVVMVVMYLVFILIDYDRLAEGAKRAIPRRMRRVAYRLGADVKTSMHHYFRGQALVASIVGVLFCVGFTIIGLPMAIVFGLFIGVLNMVPYMQLVSIPVAALLCLLSSVSTGGSFWELAGLTCVVYVVVQAIQDMVLVPRIMGKSMGLNPAIILLSLSIWGALLGIVGLLIALPVTTLIISYYNRYVVARRPRRRVRRKSPPPEPASES